MIGDQKWGQLVEPMRISRDRVEELLIKEHRLDLIGGQMNPLQTDLRGLIWHEIWAWRDREDLW